MKNQPFYWETRAVLEAINDMRFSDLRNMLDDGYGTVDIDLDGRVNVIRSKAEWEENLGRNMEAMEDALMDSEILEYQGSQADQIGYSVVRFRQIAFWSGQHLRNDSIATIVWKCGPQGWKMAHWHATQENLETLPKLDLTLETAAA